MPATIIEDPVINSPFKEPRRYYKFDDEGITNEIVEARRISSFAPPKTGRIAIKVINHDGDEVLKVFPAAPS